MSSTSRPGTLVLDVAPTGDAEVAYLPSKVRHRRDQLQRALLSAHRLPFDRLGLVGRRAEEQLLKERYRRCCSNNITTETTTTTTPITTTTRQVVLIGGSSGTGKTALPMTMQKVVHKDDGGVVCHGKYDWNLREQPFAGIFSQVCQHLCQSILISTELDTIRESLAEELDDLQRHLLGQVFPEIHEVVDNCCWTESSTTTTTNNSNKQEQMEAAFLAFVRIVAVSIHPIVILLDDLQWADTQSLDLILKTVTQDDIRIMIVMTYRSNEISENHSFHQARQSFREEQEKCGALLELTEMELGNLSLDDVKEVISELLSTDLNDISQLATVCHNRTDGNVYFVIHFLSMLVEKGFLEFDIGAYKWKFDVPTIEIETEATQNLVDILQQKIQKQDEAVTHLALLAACLGSCFSAEVLRLIREHCRISRSDDGDFDSLLEHATSEHFFELVSLPKGYSSEFKLGSRQPSVTQQRIRFVHDKIQESVIGFVPQQQFNALQDEVAMILVHHLRNDDLEDMLFVVVNLLNNGGGRNIEIARLNHRAAVKANNLSSFSSASKFVKAGLLNIPEAEAWTSHFDLTLQLHCFGAFAEHCLGKLTITEAYCDNVLAQGAASPLQKCPAVHIKVTMMHHTRQPYALVLCMDYLSKLGCEFPTKPVRRIKAPRYLGETLSKFIPTMAEIKEMPMMTIPTRIAVMELLEQAGSLAYLTQDAPLYIMVRCRYVRWVKKYGLTKSSASSFASLGNLLMHKYKMFHESVELAQLSVATQEVLNTRDSSAKFYEARTLVTAIGNVLAWRFPLETQLKGLLAAYVSGIKSGNTFSAGVSVNHYLWASFLNGTRLELVREDCQNYIPQIERMRNVVASDIIIPMWQLSENLVDLDSKNTTLLSGEVMFEKKYRSNPRIISFAPFHVFKALACMYFAEYKSGAELALEAGHDELRTKFPGMGFGCEYLPFGVCLYAEARKNKKYKYKRAANNVRSELQTLVKVGGCINLSHHLNILDAEWHALYGRSKKAAKSYRDATVHAARGGFLQDAAVAHERYAHFLLEQGNHEPDAKHHVEEALRYYSEWGAMHKVKLLLAQHQALLGAFGQK